MPAGRLYIAVEALATSAEPIQTRVGNAGWSLYPLQDCDFRHAEDVATFQRIMKALRTAPASDSGGHDPAWVESARSMTDHEAAAVAKDIFTLASRYSEFVASPEYRP
jgi:hypothetical protein